jgi:hypothetical protein
MTAATMVQSTLLDAAREVSARLRALSVEVTTLREENTRLRQEAAEVARLLQDGNGHHVTLPGVPRRRSVPTPQVQAPRGVTPQVVMAAIGKLGGNVTARQIAETLTEVVGAPVSGRAVRFLAEHGGAAIAPGEDGQRRYSLRPTLSMASEPST